MRPRAASKLTLGHGASMPASGLPVTLRALLTWLTGPLSSRAQRREERRLQRERRAELYEDMFNRTRHLIRVQSQPSIPAPRPTQEQIIEPDGWTARVALFASPEVSELWDVWLAVHRRDGRSTGPA